MPETISMAGFCVRICPPPHSSKRYMLEQCTVPNPPDLKFMSILLVQSYLHFSCLSLIKGFCKASLQYITKKKICPNCFGVIMSSLHSLSKPMELQVAGFILPLCSDSGSIMADMLSMLASRCSVKVYPNSPKRLLIHLSRCRVKLLPCPTQLRRGNTVWSLG